MRDNRDAALAVVFRNEGGFVNNPHDPGGATNLGITQRVLTAWRMSQRLPYLGVRELTRSDAAEIYEQQYMAPARFDDLPAGIDLCVLDEAVNSGPIRAAKDLQRCVRATADGHIGVLTLQACAGQRDHRDTINQLCDLRLSFLRALTTWRYFGTGWKRRVAVVRGAALGMCRS